MRFSLFGRFAAVAALSAAAALALPAVAGPGEIGSGGTPQSERTISVSGSGSANGAPTQAQLSAGVTTIAPTASTALAQNARKMTGVFDALKRLGVPERSIQTSNFSVSPQYAPNGAQRITGYQVSNQVDVTLDDTDKLGPALDALVTSGANTVNSISYGIKDPSALQTTAREAAVADAIQRARTYAKAAGVSLGPVVSIQEGATEMPRPMFAAKFMAGNDMAATPTAAGELSVTANVTVVFELR